MGNYGMNRSEPSGATMSVTYGLADGHTDRSALTTAFMRCILPGRPVWKGGSCMGHRMKPLFIVGYMHSGTTLLQNVMGRHDDVFTGSSETKFFEYRYFYKDRFPDLSRPEQVEGMIQY
ncbi:hypothetical protein GF324_06635, partial [bacterium]|nr:hypothetical protein [bacterium]